MAMKRRDLLEASRLLIKHRLVKAGEFDQTALMLAASYLSTKRDGETELEFDDWLNEDVQGDELPEDDDEDEPDPTTA